MSVTEETKTKVRMRARIVLLQVVVKPKPLSTPLDAESKDVMHLSFTLEAEWKNKSEIGNEPTRYQQQIRAG